MRAEVLVVLTNGSWFALLADHSHPDFRGRPRVFDMLSEDEIPLHEDDEMHMRRCRVTPESCQNLARVNLCGLCMTV